MHKNEVPQDKGLAEGLKEVCYAVDEDGRYVLVPSSGWEPKSVAMRQAWDVIHAEREEVRSKVLAGLLSPLAYYMVINLMDVSLLAKYVGFMKWRIKRHLKPAVFKTLKRPILQRYATVFEISVEELVDRKRIAAMPGHEDGK